MLARDELENWIRIERLKRAVRELAVLSVRVPATLLVMRGLHLALCFYDRPETRAMSDADVLVAPEVFDAVVQAALAGRFRFSGVSANAVILEHVDTGVPIDLHWSPLPAHFGRLTGGELLRAAVPAEEFGPGVRAPRSLDAALLAVANHLKDQPWSSGMRVLERDLAAIAARVGVTPDRLLDRATSAGLRCGTLATFAALGAPWSGVVPPGVEGKRARFLATIMRHSIPSEFLMVAVSRLLTDHPLDVVDALVERLGLRSHTAERGASR